MKEKTKYWLVALAFIVVAGLYWVLPIDFVPDFVQGIGRVDDILFAVVGFIGCLVNFFIGLSLGVKLTPAREERLRWEEEYRQTYGTIVEI